MIHRFQDLPEAPPQSPEDDYILVVIGVEEGFTPRGDEKIELKLRIEETGSIVYETFSTNAQWKLDSFIRSAALAKSKGDDVELSERNLLGRRGWGHVVLEEYEDKNKVKKKRNKVQRWLANEALARDESYVPKEAQPETPDTGIDEAPPF